MDVLWGTFHHAVSNPQVLLASPHLLNLMDIRDQEASRGGHILEGMGETVGLLVVIVWVACFEIYLPSCLDEFGVFPKGFPFPGVFPLSAFSGAALQE